MRLSCGNRYTTITKEFLISQQRREALNSVSVINSPLPQEVRDVERKNIVLCRDIIKGWERGEKIPCLDKEVKDVFFEETQRKHPR